MYTVYVNIYLLDVGNGILCMYLNNSTFILNLLLIDYFEATIYFSRKKDINKNLTLEIMKLVLYS